MSNEPGPDEQSKVEIHIVPHNETSLIFRDQIKMKVVQEDEKLQCVVWAKTGDGSGHTILRYGSTQLYCPHAGLGHPPWPIGQ